MPFDPSRTTYADIVHRPDPSAGRVLRRGGLCPCDVGIADAAGKLVAKALVTYKIG